MLLLLPVANAQTVLFEDAAGDAGPVGIDLIDGHLVENGTDGAEIHIRMVPDGTVDGTMRLTWEAEDWFGRPGTEIALESDFRFDRHVMGVVESDGSIDGFAAKVRVVDGDPPTYVYYGSLFERYYRGIAMHDVRATTSTGPLESDSVDGIDTLRFAHGPEHGANLQVPDVDPVQPTTSARVSGSGVPDAVELQQLYVTFDDGLRWTAVVEDLGAAAFEGCREWYGHMYAQNFRPTSDEHPWDDLVQVDFRVANEVVATPQEVVVRIDPRATVHEPNVTVQVDPVGIVQVAVEPGWWNGGADPSEHRYRFRIDCATEGEGVRSRIEYAGDEDRFELIPAPGVVVALVVALAARRR